MGKSDPYLYNFYKSLTSKNNFESAAFFGQPDENFISNIFKSNKRKFYDLSLKNWDINSLPYDIDEKFDLILCTRCAYFCKQPEKMINSYIDMLNKGGVIIVDWGLGDHWRFDNYKVGWVKDSEHEYAYSENNFLWSTIWNDMFLRSPEVVKFEKSINRFGYSSISTAVKEEVPSVLDPVEFLSNKRDLLGGLSFLTLWEKENPQIYMSLVLEKNK